MVALGRKYDTGIFLSPTKETCFLYLYTCYLDEDYVPRYARNFVLYNFYWNGEARKLLGSLQASPGPAYPFLWGHPVVPIYGDISKNRHIAAYGKGANIAFLVYARKTAKSYM